MAVSYRELRTLSLTALVSQSQSHIATDIQSVSLDVEPHLGLMNQIFINVWQLRSCFRGAPSLARGWVCLLYMLLGLASAVLPGSEFLGTRDHILLSQIWDFPVCLDYSWESRYIVAHGPRRKQSLYCWGLFTEPLHNNGRGADAIENQSHDSYLAGPLTRWLLPSNEL
jgi:hypothetical protein